MIVNNMNPIGINKIMKNANMKDVSDYIQKNIDDILQQLKKNKNLKLPFELNGSQIKGYGLELGELTDTISSLRLTAFNNTEQVQQMLLKGTDAELVESVKKANFPEIFKSISENLGYYLRKTN